MCFPCILYNEASFSAHGRIGKGSLKMCIKATSYKRSLCGPCAERAKDEPPWRYLERDFGHDVMEGDSYGLLDFPGRVSGSWGNNDLKPAAILARFGTDVMPSFFCGALASNSLCLLLRTD